MKQVVTRSAQPFLNGATRRGWGVLTSRSRLTHPLPQAFRRSASTAATGVPITTRKPFWTTTRALLLSAFASSLAYIVGVTDTVNELPKLWPGDSRPPVYGTSKDLEKVNKTCSYPGESTVSVSCSVISSPTNSGVDANQFAIGYQRASGPSR